MIDAQLEFEPPEDMDRWASRSVKDTAWLVRNESRTRRLPASSRDGRREGRRARSYQREGRIDDATFPERGAAFAAAESASTYRCGNDVKYDNSGFCDRRDEYGPDVSDFAT